MSDEIDLHDVQIRTLRILQRFKRVCDSHRIPFYLAYGTLIGAVRHHGFIPWDDDIDILMFREDYERFFAVRSELGSDYIVQDPRTTPEFWLFHAKVRQIRPKPYIEPLSEDSTAENGLFIDIFFLDHLPEQKSLSQTLMKVLLDYTRLLLSAHQWGNRDPRGLIRVLSVLARKVPKKLLEKIMRWGSTRWNDKPGDWVISYGATMNHETPVFSLADFGEPLSMVFEDAEMPVPRNYDPILRSVYGDYLQLPPLEEQVPLHHFIRNPSFISDNPNSSSQE